MQCNTKTPNLICFSRVIWVLEDFFSLLLKIFIFFAIGRWEEFTSCHSHSGQYCCCVLISVSLHCIILHHPLHLLKPFLHTSRWSEVIFIIHSIALCMENINKNWWGKKKCIYLILRKHSTQEPHLHQGHKIMLKTPPFSIFVCPLSLESIQAE